MKSLILANMTGPDTDKLLHAHMALIEEWLQQDIGECVVHWAYYGSRDKLPAHIQDSIRLIESNGYRFDWATQRFSREYQLTY
jgi:hypothetical protein